MEQKSPGATESYCRIGETTRKVLTQDRQACMNMPRTISSYSCGKGRGTIVGNNAVKPIMGVYETKERADEVLKQMFTAYRDGDKTYIMPVE